MSRPKNPVGRVGPITKKQPKKRTGNGVADLTPSQIERRARKTIERSGLATMIRAAFRRSTGRRRQYDPVDVITMALMAAIDDRKMWLTKICSYMGSLPRTMQRRVGYLRPDGTTLTYSQIQDCFRLLEDAMEDQVEVSPHNHTRDADPETGELPPCPDTCTHQRLTIETFVDGIINGSLAPDTPITRSVAIDGTDVETCAVRRYRTKTSELEDGEQLPVDDDSRNALKAAGRRLPPAPIGPDGRSIPTLDPDARDGYRTPKDGTTPFFTGYMLHVVTNAAGTPGEAAPGFILGANVTPAGSNSGTAVLGVVNNLHDRGYLDECIWDRAYTTVLPERLIRPITKLGIKHVADLHPNQKVRYANLYPAANAKSHAPILQIDGWFFTNGMPESKISLPQVPRITTTEEKAAIASQYDERWPFAFGVNSLRPDGKFRLFGPARLLRVRCVNHSPSMRIPLGRAPDTTCKKGEDCSCAATIVIDPVGNPMERILQTDLYGTTTWWESKNRRTTVENSNNLLKIHFSSVRRGFIRMFGQVKHSIFLALSLAAVNIRLERSWRMSTNQPCRWQDDPALVEDQTRNFGSPGANVDPTLIDTA